MAIEKNKMRKVRIDEILIEQIEWYDIFPMGMKRTIQARTNYCVSVGLFLRVGRKYVALKG